MGEKNCRSDGSRQAKNGGRRFMWRKEVGVKEFQEEAGEEPAEVGWTRGKSGRGTADDEGGCAQNMAEGKNVEMEGLREE